MKKTLILFYTLVLTGGLTQLTIAGDSHGHDQHTDDHAHEDDHDKKHTNNEEHEDDEHGHDRDDGHNEEAPGHDDHGDHDEEGTTKIDTNMAKQVGIITGTAVRQSLHQTITTFGRITTGPEQTSHVRARFPGVIKSVKVSIGDTVKTGDLLAVIESNESLKKYKLRAPISGTVTQRHANTGEITQEQVLFSLSNFESLWAELRVFPSQKKSLTVGKTVYIIFDNERFETTISHLLPSGGDAPHLIARAKIASSESVFFPGMMVEGRVVISEFDAPIAVANNGLQTMGEQTGIFVKHDNEYTFTPLVIGRADDEFTEVLSGIESGAEYVTKNSYLIKADIEKSEAEHEH